jgi:predicted DNA-binding transcriptional regulator YafY
MEDITETVDGRYLVNFNFIDDDYGYGILMSFGSQLICLEPDYVREKMKKRLENMVRLYI